MTVSPAQIRAARALLNWSGTDLATRLGMSPTTISMIENGKNPGSMGALRSIEATLVQAGVTFGENEGVSLRKGSIFELHGQEGLRKLMDMIYEFSLENPQGPVRINNVRQRAYAEAIGDFIVENRKRMSAIKGLEPWHILLHEEDVTADLPPMGSIRIMKDSLFGSIGQYCFGRYLALVDLNEGCHITVIDNIRLKTSWDLIFDALWRDAPQIGAKTR